MAYMSALGLDLGDLVKKGGPAIQAASKVVEDPALPEVVCHVLRLNKLTEGKDPGPPCTRPIYTTAQRHQGVGLTRVTGPLRVAVWVRSHPALAIGAGVAVIGAIGYIGYLIGKR